MVRGVVLYCEIEYWDNQDFHPLSPQASVVTELASNRDAGVGGEYHFLFAALVRRRMYMAEIFAFC